MSLLRFFIFILLGARLLAADQASFVGEWETTYGRMVLSADGANLHGTYGDADQPASHLAGQVDQSTLRFTYVEPNATGEGHFTLAPDGMNFSGEWRENGHVAWATWSGSRRAPRPRNFSGVWETDFGRMRLIQSGKTVEGCYTYEGRSLIKGTVQDDTLSLSYVEPDRISGQAEFTLTADRDSFTGTWKPKGGRPGGTWKGRRVAPQEGRVWLVVLEARWEENLRETEYSYGAMLRQFFTRIPTVAVRHRTFTGHADFAGWCTDLPYFAEPVVFYVSSHGDEKGISARTETLDGKFIGEQLRYAPEVTLVHLGSCLTMAGTVPADIRRASGLTVPVSGFTRTADWAGSAIIDFTYLDFVLERKMSPREAVQEVRRNVLFAGDPDAMQGTIAPAGLKIVEQ